MQHALAHFTAPAIAVLTALTLLSPASHAQTSYPMLMSASPVAVQVGSTAEVTLKSRYSMEGAFQVLIEGDKVSGEVIPPEPPKEGKKDTGESLKVRITAATDAVCGIRDFRIATPRGVSTVGQLFITPNPVSVEAANNDVRDTAQEVAVPSTICGKIEKAEDVDWYRFHASPKSTLTFHVQCMRLEDRIHDLQTHADPILTLRDSNGSVIAAADNVLAGDPVIRYTFEREGDYFIEMRDVRFQGNNFWEYAIEVYERPLVTCLYPLAAVAGKSQSLNLVGIGIAAGSSADVTVPVDAKRGLQKLNVNVGGGVTQSQPLFIVGEDPLRETSEENGSITAAQSITLPCGISGRIEREGDLDLFAFEAKKGERYTIQAIAHRAGSSLDSHLRILDSKGSQVQLNDDLRFGKRNYSDSAIEDWNVAADGKYFLEIRDLHLRGGEDFVYYIHAEKSSPYFNLFTDTDKTPISPGTSGVVFVRAEKKSGFDGEIQLSVNGLPAGVTASCGKILPGKPQDGCIVFTVAPDAKPMASNVQIVGTSKVVGADGSSTEKQAIANIYQEIYQPGGGRGHWPADAHTIAVTTPNDLRAVKVNAKEISLKAGTSTAIEVELERAAGFDKNVTLEVTYSHLGTIFGDSLPEGVTVDAGASQTLLTGGNSKGKIVLKAAPTAKKTEKQQFVIMANVSLNFVMKATYASEPLSISIVE